MDENKEREHTEEQQVIQEQIVPKKNKNWRRFGKGLARAAIYGVVFGLAGGVTLVFTGNLLIEKLIISFFYLKTGQILFCFKYRLLISHVNFSIFLSFFR